MALSGPDFGDASQNLKKKSKKNVTGNVTVRPDWWTDVQRPIRSRVSSPVRWGHGRFSTGIRGAQFWVENDFGEKKKQANKKKTGAVQSAASVMEAAIWGRFRTLRPRGIGKFERVVKVFLP